MGLNRFIINGEEEVDTNEKLYKYECVTCIVNVHRTECRKLQRT